MVPDPDQGFGPGTYGSSFADVYDEWHADVSDAEATADFVDRFGSGQKVLELGVGTGRIATALAARDHDVTGLDVSAAMLAHIDDASPVPVVRADMTGLPFTRHHFDLVLVATNTLFNLTTPEDQATCFSEARAALRLGGRLIVEAMVPGAPDPALDRLVTTRSISVDRVVLTATIRDETDQTITGQHIELSEQGIRLRPWRVRYSTLAELDRAAERVGFRLGERHADWHGADLTDDSPNGVSVYVAV